MLAEAEVLPPESTSTDIVLAVKENPGIVLLDMGKFDAFYDKWKADADQLSVNVETKKGRDTIRSFVADLRSEKAAIDKARLRLTEEWRGMVSQANEAGKVIKERLETLAAEVRAPLTEWEEAEEARENTCKEAIAKLRSSAIVALGDTAADVRQRGMEAWQTELDPAVFRDMLDEAQAAKDTAVATLKAALARLEKEEADLAELHKLRAAEAERLEREEAEREEAAAAEREAEQARAAEAARVAAAEAEAARIKAAEEAAAQAARDEADRKAREETEAREAAHAAELKAERDRAAQIERDAQAERDRIAAAEAERAAEAKRVADEQAAREANKAHRTRIKTAAKQAIMTCGVSEDAAQKVVLAIIAGEIPAVTLAF